MPNGEIEHETHITLQIPQLTEVALQALMHWQRLPDIQSAVLRELRLGIQTQQLLLESDTAMGDYGQSTHVNSEKQVSPTTRSILRNIGAYKLTDDTLVPLTISLPTADIRQVELLQQSLFPNKSLEYMISYLTSIGMLMEHEALEQKIRKRGKLPTP